MSTYMPARRPSRRTFLQLGAAAAAGTVVPGLAACNRAPESQGGPPGSTETAASDGSFTLYTSSNHVYDTWVDIVEQFEQDHGLTVNWQRFNWADMWTKLQADLSAGNVPDLVERPGGYDVVSLATTGEVLALDDYIAADGADMGYPDDWQPHAVSSWQYDGSTYGIQLMLTCSQLYYNRQMLEEAGISEPPGTWEDFLAVAQELTGGDRYGVALNQHYSHAWPWLLQNGVSLYDADADDFLAPRDAAVEALQFMADLVHKHEVSPVPSPGTDQTGPRNLFTANRAAMIFTGPWDIKPIREGNPDLDLAIGLPLERETRSTNLAGAGMFIPSASPRADLAWDLVKRITSLESELALTAEAGQTMPRKSWAESPEVQDNELVNAVAEALPYAEDWNSAVAPTGKVAEVEAAFQTLYQEVVLTGRPVPDTVETFVDEARRALA